LGVTRETPNITAFQEKREEIFSAEDEQFPTYHAVQRDLSTFLTAMKRYDVQKETVKKQNFFFSIFFFLTSLFFNIVKTKIVSKSH